MSFLFELEDLHFSYPGGEQVLDGIDLTLEAGERLCISGANGAGKSTLFHLMVGLRRPDSGRVIAFGRERREEKDFQDVRQRCGLVFQDPDDQLFCPTVEEDIAFGPLNLGYSKADTSAAVRRVLDQLKLSHLAERVTYKLSGGQKRLVSLATVLVMEPEVLLLDEPTNALDEESCARLTEILQNLPQAQVFISHDVHFRHQLATRRLHMDHGQLSAPAPKCRHAV